MNGLPSTSSDEAKIEFRGFDVWAPALLVALGVLFFADFLFTTKNLYYRDILGYHYPLRKVMVDAISNWEWPLWNPYLYLGQPMLANPNCAALYPTILLHLFLPFNLAFKLHFLIHPLLAGPGMYFLLRRLRIHPLAAFSGALGYEFSGPVLSFLNLFNIVSAVALIPWIGWAFVGAMERKWLRRSILTGVFLALLVTTYEPLILLSVMLVLVFLTFCQVMESVQKWTAIRSALRIGSLAGVLALGLSAIQWIPTVELWEHSARAEGISFERLSFWSTHPVDLLNTIVPNLFGNPYTIYRVTAWGEAFHDGRESFLVSYFLGGVTLLLMGVSFASPRRLLQRSATCLGIASLILALGKNFPTNRWLFDHISLFSLGRFPSKYFLLCAFVACLLAALGFEVLMDSSQDRLRRAWPLWIAASIGLAAGLFCLSLWAWWGFEPWQLERLLSLHDSVAASVTKDVPFLLSHLRRSIVSSGAFLVLGSFLVLSFIQKQRMPMIRFLLPAVLAAELLPANLSLSPLISVEDLEFVPEVTQYLQKMEAPSLRRVVSLDFTRGVEMRAMRVPGRSLAWATIIARRCGLPFVAIMNGIQFSIGAPMEGLNTQESHQLFLEYGKLPSAAALQLLEKLGSPIILTRGIIPDPRARLVRSFDTGTDMALNLYYLEQAMPRAYFVTGVVPAAGRAQELHAILDPDFSFAHSVVLGDSNIHPVPPNSVDGIARVLDYRNNYVRCEVQAGASGFLVLLDSYYPGWNVSVDGKETRLLRANYAFRAVQVPSGSHIVEFRYRPLSFIWGLGITLATALTGACLLMLKMVTGLQNSKFPSAG